MIKNSRGIPDKRERTMQAVELLYEAALTTFTQQQEVHEIFLFGSFERGTFDQYSDLDLFVISADFEKTMALLPQILARIGDVLLSYPLHIGRGSAAYMTLFKNYPFYTKLDLN